MRIPVYADLINKEFAYKKDGVIHKLPFVPHMVETFSEKNTLVTIGVWANHVGLLNVNNIMPGVAFGMLKLQHLSIEEKVEVIDRLEKKHYEQNEPK